MICWREMTSLFHAVAAWWMNHPGWQGFIYFVAAVWVALFTDRARRLAVLPLIFPVKGLLWLMQRQMKRQLEIMQHVQKDTFKLAVYVGFYCADSFVYAVWSTALFLLLANILAGFQSSRAHIPSFYSLILAPLFVRAWHLKSFLAGYFDYDKTVSWLEDQVGKVALK